MTGSTQPAALRVKAKLVPDFGMGNESGGDDVVLPAGTSRQI